jgi:hypothetical protein
MPLLALAPRCAGTKASKPERVRNVEDLPMGCVWLSSSHPPTSWEAMTDRLPSVKLTLSQTVSSPAVDASTPSTNKLLIYESRFNNLLS